MVYFLAIFITALSGIIFLRYNDVLFPNVIERHDNLAPQASHVGEPLRYGGLAVFMGLVFGCAALKGGGDKEYFILLLLSAIPVIITGLFEDMGHLTSPRKRLFAAMASALLAVALLGVWVPRADLPGLNWMMSFFGISLALTVLFSAGFCHAVNLIDGVNGLAATFAIFSALSVALIASKAGETEIMTFLLMLAACLAGFLVLNWPNAQMFLGDAGAYGVGHLLAWCAILLVSSSDEVVVPALLLALFWPLADVFHSIFRRLANRKKIFHPDRMHIHHKVRRALDLLFFGYNSKKKSNPLTAPILAPFMAAPILTGALFWDQLSKAWIALVLYMLGFVFAHKLTIHLALRYRKQAR